MGRIRMFLGATRAAVGLAAWVAPVAGFKAFGVEVQPEARFAARLFGARDLALGASLLASDATHLRAITTVAMVVDSVDVVAGLDEYRRGTIGPWALFSGAGGAALLVALGALVLRDEVTSD